MDSTNSPLNVQNQEQNRVFKPIDQNTVAKSTVIRRRRQTRRTAIPNKYKHKRMTYVAKRYQTVRKIPEIQEKENCPKGNFLKAKSTQGEKRKISQRKNALLKKFGIQELRQERMKDLEKEVKLYHFSDEIFEVSLKKKI